ncbi:membrane protein containing Acyltransferase 3 domain protein [Rhodopirellula maiorica SM1]|uniref:Membrane protein containing Acyltransferase 3 domain protein n=1 Tax=Rhodopirellula maiorica SM1 TaxID=1265738 RepID=M5RAX7_9BACT|nr:acyltransferase [Rhodopirellula maiorica]EMI16530.1 membrane protein containing Acyltransferase 3 domain protein [Rhodopirellula maiorica SM1]
MRSSSAVNPALREKILGLDGLRALACIAVFLVHWHQETGFSGNWGPFNLGQFLQNGNIGVAVFMILSGFFASMNYLTPEGPRLASLADVRRFASRRMYRILPAYYVCLLAMWLAGGDWQSSQGWLDLLLHLLCLHNFFEFSLYSISSPLWAIAVFVQWYFAFTVVIAVSSRLGIHSSGVLLMTFCSIAVAAQLMAVAMSVTSASVHPSWFGSDATLRDHSLLSHMPLFVLGMGMFFARKQTAKVAPVRCDAAILLICLTVIAIISTPLDVIVRLPSFRYMFPTVPLLLAVAVSLVPQSKIVRTILEGRVLLMTGRLSYLIYLFHDPVLGGVVVAARSFGHSALTTPLVLAVAAFAMTVLVAYIFEFAFELVTNVSARLCTPLLS